MLREGVEIMKAMWTDVEVTYDGKYYQLDRAISQPKPLQHPHIPFWIAGGGEQLTLNVAARYAQYTNFGVELDEFIHKSEVLKGHCEDVGTDYQSIVRSSNFNVFCAPTESEVEDKIDWARSVLRDRVPDNRADWLAKLYLKTSGTPKKIVAMLKEWEDAGMSYAIINFADAAYDTTGLELFASEVIPAFSG
jgi:alkanesulfonate monooxygenase SsuD/methylene tetrahydromethanopterin reductase-like flavin-dependent oxidoreductase (luciferase family)